VLQLFSLAGIFIVNLIIPFAAQSEWTGSLCNVHKNACIAHCASSVSEHDASCAEQCDIAAQACDASAQSKWRWEQSMKRCLSLPSYRQNYKIDIAVAWRKRKWPYRLNLLTLRHFRENIPSLDRQPLDEKSRTREVSRELRFAQKITSDLIANLGDPSPEKDPADLFSSIATGVSAYQVLSDAASRAILTVLANQGGRGALIQTAILVKQAAEESNTSSDLRRQAVDILKRTDTLIAQISNFQAMIGKIQHDNEDKELDYIFRTVQIARELCSKSIRELPFAKVNSHLQRLRVFSSASGTV
jgi:hypothetical protein